MIKLFVTSNKKEKKLLINEMNRIGKTIYDNEYSRCMENAKSYNDDVAKIFDDWWNGQCVSTKEYESQFSKRDLEDAGSIILETVSRGFG